MQNIVNPFYAARMRQSDPQLVRIPMAPKNASPVPSLTSLYHNSDAGTYGQRSYPGNCGGNLIKDLLNYFQPTSVFDPMTGSGTCRDVCVELGVDCYSTDLNQGFNATDSTCYQGLGKFDFIWAHPPYWRQKIYSDLSTDLSQAMSLPVFLRSYEKFIRNCVAVLEDGGRLAILMGDYNDHEAGFVPLTYHTKEIAFSAGLTQCCTDIVRFSFGASSSKKVYQSSFIPSLHDVCMVFEKRSRRR